MNKVSDMPADASKRWLDEWSAGLAAAEKEGFEPLETFDALPDGASVERSSKDFASKVLQPEFDPWQTSARVQRSVHRAKASTPDLLRHRFRVDGYDVTVTETINYLRIAIRSSQSWDTDEQSLAKSIGDLAERTLRTTGRKDAFAKPYTWSFSYFTLGSGARFSTAPTIDILRMRSWTERADGGLDNGHPYFMLFRNLDFSTGRMVLRPMDARRWFDGTCWKIYE